MPKTSPLLQKTIDWLKSTACGDTAGTAGRHAPIRDLAGRAGVSYSTMWKALRLLGRQTRTPLLRTARGTSPAVDTPRRSHQWTARAIAADIAAGRIAADRVLPSFKNLSNAYRTSYRTLVKALDVLCRQELCRRVGSRYVVRTVQKRSQQAAILLVTKGQVDGTILMTVDRGAALLSSVRRECERVEVCLVPVPYYHRDEDIDTPLLRQAVTAARAGRPVIGTILFDAGMSTAHLDAILQELTGNGRLAIIDENGIRPSAGGRNRVLFTIGTTCAPGRIMGNYLLNNGHRTVAYLSRDPSVAWSRNRLLGLREAWAGAGLDPEKIRVCAPEPPAGQPAGMEWTAHDVRVRSLLQPLARGTRADRYLGRAVALHAERLYTTMHTLHRRDQCEGCIEQAAAIKEATAWVGENDDAALAALHHLASRRMKRRPAVVGFDDCEEALLAGLTSFSFDIPALAHAAVGCITGAVPPRLLRDQPVEINGAVTVRESG